MLPGVLQLNEAQRSFNAGFLLAEADITGGTKWNSGTRDSLNLGECAAKRSFQTNLAPYKVFST